ncbi:MAG: hypothetical protein ACI4VQ_04220 [Clostridia bacterium]
MENEKLDQILNVVLEVKKDVVELKEAKEEKENEIYLDEQNIQIEAIKNKIYELERKVAIHEIKIKKLFKLAMLERQAQ